MSRGAGTLTAGFLITIAFALVEALTGLWSGSLALMSDAGHMLTDACALAVAAIAAGYAARSGLERTHPSEYAAAVLNVLLMIGVVAGIVYEALQRLEDPVSVKAGPMLLVAVLGLLVNLATAWIVSRGAQTLNSRAAMLHVIGDALGSVAAIVAAVVILETGWMPIDPILSLLVAALISYATLNLIRATIHDRRSGSHVAHHSHGHGHHGHHHHH